ncbi:MAG: DUF389 domain-containing protein [Flavobacteriales bacterium]|nr:DUF389 domain-containing protein [Flavobacteriales bacterium]
MNPSEDSQTKGPEAPASPGFLEWWKDTVAMLRPHVLDRLRIVDLAEPEQTMQGIERDTEFRGFNVWILVFSIVIASIGLNVNSTAVIIGAMLISPLMGPIMGVGLGVGVNNLDLIRKSVGNLGVATGIAIMSSALYFLISPIDEAGSELLSRTNPTFLDVMVAFFGGLTGILAGSRKEKNNVIPGVAIATALMPPLCTAGYGLAHLDGGYFFGALYLFLINAILIATSTTLVVRYLRFPIAQPVDAAKEQKYKRYFMMGLAALVLPSAFILYNTVTQSVKTSKLQEFISETVVFPGTEVVKREVDFPEGKPVAHVVLLGSTVPTDLVLQWQDDLAKAMPEAELQLVQNEGPSGLEDLQRMVNLYAEGQTALSLRDAELVQLRTELSNLKDRDLPSSLASEILAQAPDVSGVEVANRRFVGRDGLERVVPWVDVQVAVQDSLDSLRMVALEQQIGAWLLLRLDADSVALQIREK